MAKVNDPNFGAGFDSDLFRSAITSAMIMGLPEAESEQATFVWKNRATYSVADPEGNPYDLDAEPETEVQHENVQIPVAVEFFGSKGDGTSIGEFDQNRVVLTVLDVHYEMVKGAKEVLLGGNTYYIDYVAPPQGLFDVTIYSIYLMSMDES